MAWKPNFCSMKAEFCGVKAEFCDGVKAEFCDGMKAEFLGWHESQKGFVCVKPQPKISAISVS